MTHDARTTMLLSPLEKTVLAACERYRSVVELQELLAGEFKPDRVPGAIAFLARRRLLERKVWDEENNELPSTRPGLYKQTMIGLLLLQAQRRDEIPAVFPRTRRPGRRRGLHVV
jgi:hypothetical protein